MKSNKSVASSISSLTIRQARKRSLPPAFMLLSRVGFRLASGAMIAGTQKKLAYDMLIPSELGDETFTQQEILREVASILYELAHAAEECGLSVAPYFQRLSALGLGIRDAAPGSPGRPNLDN
jgi:hypothetical protein